MLSPGIAIAIAIMCVRACMRVLRLLASTLTGECELSVVCHKLWPSWYHWPVCEVWAVQGMLQHEQ